MVLFGLNPGLMGMWCLVMLAVNRALVLGRILNGAVLGSLGAHMLGGCSACKGGTLFGFGC